MFRKLARRDFLKQGGALAILTAGATGGCEPILDAIANRPVRRDIATLDPSGSVIQSYKDAVSAMKTLPPSDPRNWERQAMVHNDHCPHGNWYFLPWHRAYLFYFEEICRAMSGNDDFALPYWHWQKNRNIPGPFWGAGNPLFDGTRSATASSVASNAFVGQLVIQDILEEPNFLLFGSQPSNTQRGFAGYGSLEQTPHNYIHGFVGGNMQTFMSPRDPVFWCHHNMVDCMWVEWNIKRQNPNTNDPQWSNFTFTDNFVDRDGNSVDIQVLTTVLMPVLSYRFDDPAKGDALAVAQFDSDALRQFLEAGAAVSLPIRRRFELSRGIEVAVDRPASQSIALIPEQVAPAVEGVDRERLLLEVDGVQAPVEDDFFVRVFVNKPDATRQTSIEDPHYAGSFAFFCDEKCRDWKLRFTVDVTDAVRRLNQAGMLAARDRIEIQLVAVPFPGRPVSEDSFSLK